MPHKVKMLDTETHVDGEAVSKRRCSEKSTEESIDSRKRLQSHPEQSSKSVESNEDGGYDGSADDALAKRLVFPSNSVALRIVNGGHVVVGDGAIRSKHSYSVHQVKHADEEIEPRDPVSSENHFAGFEIDGRLLRNVVERTVPSDGSRE